MQQVKLYTTLDIATTISISIMDFNFEVLVYLEGLLKFITSHKNYLKPIETILDEYIVFYVW